MSQDVVFLKPLDFIRKLYLCTVKFEYNRTDLKNNYYKITIIF